MQTGFAVYATYMDGPTYLVLTARHGHVVMLRICAIGLSNGEMHLLLLSVIKSSRHMMYGGQCFGDYCTGIQYA
jgi:hypothetical protein